MTVPNQRIIKIHKDNQQKDPFVALNLDTMASVYNDLGSAYAFYFYLCLCGNADGFNLEFSPQHFKDRYGLPISTTHDQFKKLVEKKYLIPKQENSNIYDFYYIPEHLKDQENQTQPPFRFE
jgi:hypothetical protein